MFDFLSHTILYLKSSGHNFKKVDSNAGYGFFREGLCSIKREDREKKNVMTNHGIINGVIHKLLLLRNLNEFQALISKKSYF